LASTFTPRSILVRASSPKRISLAAIWVDSVIRNS
jgi:hypothetical protein